MVYLLDMRAPVAGGARRGQLRHPGVGLLPARHGAGPAQPGHGGGGLGRHRRTHPVGARLAASHLRPPRTRARPPHLLDARLYSGDGRFLRWGKVESEGGGGNKFEPLL